MFAHLAHEQSAQERMGERKIEDDLENRIAMANGSWIQETEMLLHHMSEHIRESGNPDRAKMFLAKACELQRKAFYFQELERGMKA